jgi:hypothetical protein
VPDAGANATYDWSITGQGTLTGGDNTPSITWNALAAGNATLNVVVADGNGCECEGGRDVPVRVCSPPNQPSNVSPVNATCIALPVTLEASPFSDPDPGDTHAASQWQVRTSTGSYGSPAYDSGTDPVHLTSIVLTSGELEAGVTYYWHVRYQDDLGFWSSYSAETSFTTANTPTGANVTVTEGTTTVTYRLVTTGGCTFITETHQNPGGRLPHDMCALLPYVDITTNADVDPPITVGLAYDESRVSNESTLRLYHWESPSWVDCTTYVDTVNNVVYGQVNSLSPFCIGEDCACDAIICSVARVLGLVKGFLGYFVGNNDELTAKGNATSWDLGTIISNTADLLAQLSLLFPAETGQHNTDMNVLR